MPSDTSLSHSPDIQRLSEKNISVKSVPSHPHAESPELVRGGMPKRRSVQLSATGGRNKHLPMDIRAALRGLVSKSF
jgi:hypothetical protein